MDYLEGVLLFTIMPSLKIYPPNQLPEKGVTNQLFEVWTHELEVYVGQDERMAVFLPRGRYSTWEAYDTNPDRIAAVLGGDAAAQLPIRRRELATFLSIVGKACDIQHYNVIVRHSTSLEWIYNKLREDYDIQQKGIHFFNLFDLKYQPGEPAVGFYNKYRNLVAANLGRNGDVIAWQGDAELAADERLSPTFEDMILANVLGLIDHRLPNHIKEHYHHLIGRRKRLMDFKTDILVKIPTFLAEIESKPHNGTIHYQPEEHLGAMRFQQSSSRGRGLSNNRGAFHNYQRPPRRDPQPATAAGRTYQNSAGRAYSVLYCRLCHVTGQPESVIKSHRTGDPTCPKISAADRQYIEATRSAPRLNAMESLPQEDSISAVADIYGYDQEEQGIHCNQQDDQVSIARSVPNIKLISSKITHPTCPPLSRTLPSSNKPNEEAVPRCNFIQPVPSQILTVFTSDKRPLHIELDSNATVNYIRLDAAKAMNFSITPNQQLSILADGVTKLPAIGEINEVFYRNDWTVHFKAVVVSTLHTQLIGGTVFLKSNNILQDFNRNTIQVAGKYIVPATSAAMLLPIQPQNHLCKITSGKTLLPGQAITVPVPFSESKVVAVEPEDNGICNTWLQPQLCTVTQGAINIANNSDTAVILGKDLKQLQVRPTTLLQPPTQVLMPQSNMVPTTIDLPGLPDRTTPIPQQAVQIIQAAQETHRAVFDNNLTKGYNGASGPHVCRLNWAGQTRPTADQVRMVSYSHELKQLHQAVCDDLTHQQVLGIPQDHNINVQFVCPSFLRRKPRAKGKPNHLLTKDDVRLVVNFSPVNEHLKNIPSVKTTPNDILVALGRWKCIIIFDLHQGFFQNHMDPQDCPWLGIATPFGGIRFLRRSGQGLLGQSEELEELLTKVLKPELQAGHCCKIADDIIIGADTYEAAATIYKTVLAKLEAANLKLAASKTHIFPQTADILGWQWHEGGKLSPSPHRRLALKNTKQEDIVTIKDMRSWVGLYKTLLIATPNLATIMDPFDQATASMDSKDKVIWTTELASAFRTAKNHIDSIKDLYLPSPHDQLLLVPDGSQKTPGIGHVLYALVDGHRKPVRYHSVKLPENCKKWSPCEIEALAFATGIQAEIDLIMESQHPLLIAPDSNPVKDAVNLIKKGKFSASARMNSFITNVNRIPVEVLHASGKANLNAVGDMQSRNPSHCDTQHCTICTFVLTSMDSVLNPKATLGAISSRALYNTKSWAAAQSANVACKTASSHLRTGKQPSKKSGAILTEIRRYCAIAKIGKDGCLIVPQTTVLGTSQLDKIIIPTPLLPSLLWNIHNSENHPSKTQLRAIFDKMFYGIMVQQHIDNIYSECYQCKVQAVLPKPSSNHTTCTEVSHPGQYFHADVVRREKQKILILRDNFSSLTAATFIPTEQHQHLRAGIIALANPIRLAHEVTVRTDNATGFQALVKDQDLAQLGITVVLADSHNKNANAVVDRACHELETEITKLQPQGGEISDTILARSILLLNTKIRRHSKLSAMEIHFSRDQATSSNLHLDDKQLREEQLTNRQAIQSPCTAPVVQQGDTVVLAEKPAKHTVRDVFIVTEANDTKVQMQKLAHPFTTTPTLRAKIHVTTHDRLHPIHQPCQQAIRIRDKTPSIVDPPEKQWLPIPSEYYTQDDSEAEDEEEPVQPNNIQQMAAWLQQQRARTVRARQEQENAIQAFLPPPPPSPPPPPRQAKMTALQNMRETGARGKTPKIPQLEGAEPTPETTPDSSLDQENHYLSPEVPWSPQRPSSQQDDYSEGDLDATYQRQMDDGWEWDNMEQQLSFLQPIEPFIDEVEDDLYQLPYPPNDLPQRRHTFNGFVLPTTFTRRRNH